MKKVMRVTGCLLVIVTVLCVMGLRSASADRGRGRHGQLYVVPTPGEIEIDGELDDWDLSGQIEMFVEEATRSTQNAKLAAMYDEEALYI
ncbi:MAG: hypothetical protein ACOCTQ_04405, partial [Planctomycetota bacterium]